MDIEPKVIESPTSSVFCESEGLPQVLDNSLEGGSEEKEIEGKKGQLKFARSKESIEVNEFMDTANVEHLPSVPDEKVICTSKMKLSHLPLFLFDKQADNSGLERLTSSPQDHSCSKIKMQDMRSLSPGQNANNSRLEHFETHSPNQNECLSFEHFKSSSSSDHCSHKTKLKHAHSTSCDNCTKKCKKEQFTRSSFEEKATCKSKIASEQNIQLLANGKQSPHIEAKHFETNDRYMNHHQLHQDIPRIETEEMEIQNGAVAEDCNHLEYNKTFSNASPAHHCSRLTDSSIIPIHLQNQCQHASVNKPLLLLSSPGSAKRSPRSIPMREAVDPSKYTKVPDGDGFKFKCSNCGNVYKWRKSLNKHWKEKHDMPWFRSTSVTGMDGKLIFPVSVECSAEGPRLQGRASTSAEYARSFPYPFYAQSPQRPFSMESSPSTHVWDLRFADSLNFRNISSSALRSDLSENSSIRNRQMHDQLGRHVKDFCGTLCPSSHSSEQRSAGDLLLKMPQSDIGTWDIPLIPQLATRSDRASVLCPGRSSSNDQSVDCILDLSSKGQECMLAFPGLSSSIQEHPLDLSVKSSSQKSILQKNFLKKTKNTDAGPCNMSTALPGTPFKSALCSNQSKTWPFCSRCSIRFSSVQELNLHFVRNHLEHPTEHGDSAGKIEEKILPKIDIPPYSEGSVCQPFNVGNTCFVCHLCFLTRQKLAQHFDKEHRHIRQNPYQSCLHNEDPVPNVPKVDKNFLRAPVGFYQQYDRVATSACSRDELNTETNESGCFKNISNDIIPLSIRHDANRTISSFSDPSGVKTEEISCELEASKDGIYNSDFNQKRRWASLSCIAVQDQTMPHFEPGVSSDAPSLCKNNIPFSYDAVSNAGNITSFTDLVSHDTVLNSETLTTLCKLGTPDRLPNAVNLTLSQHVTHDAKRNTERTLLSSTREVKRGLGKAARNSKKDTGSGDKNLRYKCDFCEFRARWPSEMTQHKKNHSTDKPFKCNYCSYKSKWKWDVRKHLKRCGSEHQRLKKEADGAVCEPEPVAAASDSAPAQMPSQGVSLDSANTSGALDRHAKRSSLKRNLRRMVQKEMEKTKGRFSLENHVLTPLDSVAGTQTTDSANKGKGHSCIHCKFTGQSAAELKHHARVHLHLKPYTCKMCCYSTKWKSDLKKHMRTLSHELGARRSVEVSRSSGCSILNNAVCPYPGNVESKVNSHNTGMVGGKWNNTKQNVCNSDRIAFLDGRLQCRFCNYSSIEITLCQNHECLIKDKKASKEGFGDQLAFWDHLGLQRRDELKPAELMKLENVAEKLEGAVPELNSPKVSSETISCSTLNGDISTNSATNSTKFKLCDDTETFCVASIIDLKVDKSCHDVPEI